MNNSSPNMLSWRIPDFTFIHEDFSWLTMTLCFLTGNFPPNWIAFLWYRRHVIYLATFYARHCGKLLQNLDTEILFLLLLMHIYTEIFHWQDFTICISNIIISIQSWTWDGLLIDTTKMQIGLLWCITALSNQGSLAICFIGRLEKILN